MTKHWIFRLYRSRQMSALARETPFGTSNYQFDRLYTSNTTTSEYVLTLPSTFQQLGAIASKLVLADSYLYEGSVCFAVLAWEANEGVPIDQNTPMQLFNMGMAMRSTAQAVGVETPNNAFLGTGADGYASFDLDETPDPFFHKGLDSFGIDDYYCARVNRFPKKGRPRQWVFQGVLRNNDVVRRDNGNLVLRMDGSFFKDKFPAYHSVMRTIPWARVGYSANEDGSLDKREILEFGYYLWGVSDERQRRRNETLASAGYWWLMYRWQETVNLLMQGVRKIETGFPPRCSGKGYALFPIEMMRGMVRMLKMWCNHCDLCQGADDLAFTDVEPRENLSVIASNCSADDVIQTVLDDRAKYLFCQKPEHSINARVQVGIQQRAISADKVIKEYDRIVATTPQTEADTKKGIQTNFKAANLYLGGQWLNIQKDVLGALMLLFTWERTLRVAWHAYSVRLGRKFVPMRPGTRDMAYTKPTVDGRKAAARSIPLCSVFTLWPGPYCPGPPEDEDDDDDNDEPEEVPVDVPEDRKKKETPDKPKEPNGWNFVPVPTKEPPTKYPPEGPEGGAATPKAPEPNWTSWDWWTTPLPPEQVIPVAGKFAEISVAIETGGLSLGAESAVAGGAGLAEAGAVGLSRGAASEVGTSYFVNAAGRLIKVVGNVATDLGPNKFLPPPTFGF